MEIVGAVFARGGSKGIPKKNLCKINGLSLVEIALEKLFQSNLCKEVFLCSDSKEILNTKSKFEFKKFQRDPSNCQDKSNEFDAWKELAMYLVQKKGYKKKDLLLIAPTTSPLRKLKTIIEIVNKLNNDPKADGIICIKPSHWLPDFNLLRYDEDNFLNTYLEGDRKINRQQAVKSWEMTTVAYCYRLSAIIHGEGIFNLKTIGYNVKFPESLDIDIQDDLDLARYLFNYE